MEVELVLVRFGAVEDLDVGVLHSDGKPVPGRAVAQAEYLRAKVVLLQLPSLPQIPGSYSVIQTSCPQLGSVCRYVDTARTVRVSLELSDLRLIMQVPHGNVTVTAAAEAYLGVWTDSQGVAGRGRARHLCLDSWRGRGQVPDTQIAGLSTHHQGPTVRQQLDRSDVVLPLQTVQLTDRGLVGGLGDVPHLHTTLTARVHKLGGVGHGDGAHDLAVGERVDLPGVARDARRTERVVREADRLQLVVTAHVERVGRFSGGSRESTAIGNSVLYGGNAGVGVRVVGRNSGRPSTRGHARRRNHRWSGRISSWGMSSTGRKDERITRRPHT